MAQGFRIEKISAGFLIMLALWLLVLPLRWLLAAFVAAAFHEFCHVAAVAALGGGISGISASWGGARLESRGLSAGKQLCCSLAGPLGGMLLLFTARWAPVIAICGVIQSIYNLLPVWPLDGGQALRLGLRMLFRPTMAVKISEIVEMILLFSLCGAAIYAAFWLKLGILPILVPLAVILKKNSLQTESEKSTIEDTIQ